MRLFQLHRDEDSSGVSGTGIVAEGIEFTNRECVIHWLAKKSSMGIYATIDDVVTVHGHDGRTRVVWVEPTSMSLPPTVYVKPETPCSTCGASPRGPKCPVNCNESP
jgi:hypothetical protein